MIRKKIKLMLICLTILTITAVFSFTACAQEAEVAEEETAEEATEETSEEAAEDGLTMGLVHMSTTHPYHIGEIAGAREMARRRGAEMIVTTGEFELEKQISAVEDLLLRDLDVLTILPLDQAAFEPIYDEVVDMGIPLVVLQSYDPPEQAEMISGYDEIVNSERMAEYAVEILEEKYGEPRGQVAAIGGVLGQDAHNFRSEGFTNIIDQYPDIELAAITPANYVAEEALAVMEDYIVTYPDLDVVFCFADEMAVAAAQALEAAGKSDDITVLGFGGTQRQAVESGAMEATLVFGIGPESTGYMHQLWAYKVAMGEDHPEIFREKGYVMNTSNIDKWNELFTYVEEDITQVDFDNREEVLKEFGILE